jgi:aspartyl-tRNA(Asn)/glutamyl-tRNA(Gln) amidotransferase subunit B
MFNFTKDVVIGLEIHMSLKTNSKLFCSCKNSCVDENAAPNSNVCPVCLGHPGSKPVINKKVLEYALKLCKAAHCRISPHVIFSRKSYFYPDLSKNFQTSQYEIPIGNEGFIELPTGKKVNLIRIHIEEDPASLVHVGASLSTADSTLIDYNRSGDPLCELVTAPEIDTPEEAREFMKTLIAMLNHLEIFDIKKCTIKADANVSIKESGYIRAEIKNVGGFKDIERALKYEIERQKRVFKEGGKLILETRGFDSESGQTYSMRSKETEADYGYIIDTDLPQVSVKDWKIEIPKMPVDFANEFAEKYKDKGIKFEDVYIIANHKVFGKAYLKAVNSVGPELATKWFRHIIPTPFLAKYSDINEIEEINEAEILELIELFSKGKVSDLIAKQILEKLVTEKFSPISYLKEHNLEMVSNTDELLTFCKESIETSPQAVEDHKKGEPRAVNFLVGNVMKKSKGKANPGEVKKIIEELLAKL